LNLVWILIEPARLRAVFPRASPRIFLRDYSNLLFSMIAVSGFPAVTRDPGGDVKRQTALISVVGQFAKSAARLLAVAGLLFLKICFALDFSLRIAQLQTIGSVECSPA